jgi:hypothetical protein
MGDMERIGGGMDNSCKEWLFSKHRTRAQEQQLSAIILGIGSLQSFPSVKAYVNAKDLCLHRSNLLCFPLPFWFPF